MPSTSERPRVVERAAGPEDVDWMEVVDDHSGWRGQAGAPRPSRWSGVLAHRVIERSDQGPVGYVTVYAHDPRAATAWVAVATRTGVPPGSGLLGAALVVDRLFLDQGLRRVFFEASDRRLATYRRVLDLVDVEHHGTL